MTAIFWIFRLDAAVARRSLVPPAAAGVGGVLQPESRRQRRAEDDGHHRRRAVRRRATSRPFYIPFWVVLLAHTAIGLGTLAGGWRIIHTMGSKITKLQPVGGFAAETGAAMALMIATLTRRAGQHHPRDHRVDCRRRRDAAAVGGALGRGRPDRLGLGADDSRGVRDRRRHLPAAAPRGARSATSRPAVVRSAAPPFNISRLGLQLDREPRAAAGAVRRRARVRRAARPGA